MGTQRVPGEGCIRIVMITGDNGLAASAVAHELGIDDFEAEVLPEHKSDVVKKLQAEGRTVAMAGDGSTTLRHWRRQTWALPWGLVQMLRSKVEA
jgi:magnesium-transporting ATPase (P-type)